VKHDDLRGVAHNVADSFVSGIGLPIGTYATDVFAEARNTSGQAITVDFLNGAIACGNASASLTKAAGLYRQAFKDISTTHGVLVSSFRVLSATYHADGRVVVAIEDNQGRRSTDEYVGLPLRHKKIADALGRVRTVRNPKRG
jgi:hypothetical protein